MSGKGYSADGFVDFFPATECAFCVEFFDLAVFMNCTSK